MSFEFEELQRRFNNMFLIGTIAEVSEPDRQFRVKLDVDGSGGDVLTGWLPWPASIGRNYINWHPLKINTQVLLACPQGDPEKAMIIQMLYSNALPPPSTAPELDIIRFDDGTIVQHHSGTHETTVISSGNVLVHAHGETCTLKSDGDLLLEAAGNLSMKAAGAATLEAANNTIKGPTAMEGGVTQTGGDMTSDGVSVQSHLHPGIQPGDKKTGAPQ